MRRLMAGLVVLVILGICSPSFGYLLLYKVSMTARGADVDTDAKANVPLKGYLLLNLDDNNEIADANLILYGRDTDKAKKYVLLNISDSASLLEGGVWYSGGLMFVDLSGYDPFDFEIFLSGKTKLRNVGLGKDAKKSIAGRIKGVTMVWDGFLLGPSDDQDVTGSAKARALLWKAAIKAINDPDETWTQDEVIVDGKDLTGGHENSLIEMLEDKGYEEATLPTI
jgi:hypothetical protein